MKTLIIYDNEGLIIQNVAGFYKVPNGLPYLEVEIPQDKYVVSIDVENKVPVYADLPPTETEILGNKISTLEAENKQLKEVNKEQDKLLVDNIYKITMLEMNSGGM